MEVLARDLVAVVAVNQVERTVEGEDASVGLLKRIRGGLYVETINLSVESRRGKNLSMYKENEG